MRQTRNVKVDENGIQIGHGPKHMFTTDTVTSASVSNNKVTYVVGGSIFVRSFVVAGNTITFGPEYRVIKGKSCIT